MPPFPCSLHLCLVSLGRSAPERVGYAAYADKWTSGHGERGVFGWLDRAALYAVGRPHPPVEHVVRMVLHASGIAHKAR